MKRTRQRVPVLVWCLAAGGISAATVLTPSAQSDALVTWDEAAAATYLDTRPGLVDRLVERGPRKRYLLRLLSWRPAVCPGTSSRSTGVGERWADTRASAISWQMSRRGFGRGTRSRRTTPTSGTEPQRPANREGRKRSLNALILSNHDAATGTLSANTRAAFDHLWVLQEQSGDSRGAWPWLFFGLQPWESIDGPFYGAALAAVAVGIAPENYAATSEVQERLDLLRAVLCATLRKAAALQSRDALVGVDKGAGTSR